MIINSISNQFFGIFFYFLSCYKMSIEQYFKPNIPNEDIDNTDSSSDIDSDLEETRIELPNINRRTTQKGLNFKKKKVRLSKKKTGAFQKDWLEIYKWLIYDGSKNLMFCSLCQIHRKQNKFGKEGNISFFL
jgi:hypothetical protein